MKEIDSTSLFIGMLTAIFFSLIDSITNFIYEKAWENKDKDKIIYKMFCDEPLSDKEIEYRSKIIKKENEKEKRKKRKNNTI